MIAESLFLPDFYHGVKIKKLPALLWRYSMDGLAHLSSFCELHDSPKQDEKVFKKGGGRMSRTNYSEPEAIGQRRAARVHTFSRWYAAVR
ncbi:hypothetical protein ACLB1E_32375 [Escherichia coli]